MFQLDTVSKYARLRVATGGNGGLAEAHEQQGFDHPPRVAGNGGSPSSDVLSSIQSATSANTGGRANPVVARSPANPPNPPPPQHEIRGQVIDLRAYLLKICQRLPMPPERLLKNYFTADDLADIRAGRYPDPHALASFIKTDPRYPFDDE